MPSTDRTHRTGIPRDGISSSARRFHTDGPAAMSKFRPDRRHPVNERERNDRPLPERRRRKKATAEARTRIGSLRAPTVRLSAVEGPDGQRTDDTGRCEASRLPHEAAFEVEKIRNGNDTPKRMRAQRGRSKRGAPDRASGKNTVRPTGPPRIFRRIRVSDGTDTLPLENRP